MLTSNKGDHRDVEAGLNSATSAELMREVAIFVPEVPVRNDSPALRCLQILGCSGFLDLRRRVELQKLFGEREGVLAGGRAQRAIAQRVAQYRTCHCPDIGWNDEPRRGILLGATVAPIDAAEFVHPQLTNGGELC